MPSARSAKTGLLLVNLGSPDNPSPTAVAQYLKEFLMDPYVVSMPYILRFLLVRLAIIPRRKFSSSEAYKKIWRVDGSPLVRHTADLTAATQDILGDSFVVRFGMRYGNPSIESALTELKYQPVERIHVFPLYPQYAASSTETALTESQRVAKALGMEKKLYFLEAFYQRSAFITALAASCVETLEKFQPDHLLFSFHGLPVRAIQTVCEKADSCLRAAHACSAIDIGNQSCYRAQAYATAQAVAHRLRLPSEFYSIAFQSRLTKNWIQPFTDVELENLARRGVRRLAVVCPSFVADCLETLEEISIRAAKDFRRAGGKELRLVPCLNSNRLWAETVAQWVKEEDLLLTEMTVPKKQAAVSGVRDQMPHSADKILSHPHAPL